METVGIVLNIDQSRVDEFLQGFREHELPIWQDYVSRGVMLHASLSRMDISTAPVSGAIQFLVSVTFADGQGHHLHDSDPRFQAWNQIADAFQVASPIVTGGEVVLRAGAVYSE
ncbi:MAG TPA: hypothetical protein VID03_01965 [Acidimicrobiia bacterium]|jgi:hypothetical protein